MDEKLSEKDGGISLRECHLLRRDGDVCQIGSRFGLEYG